MSTENKRISSSAQYSLRAIYRDIVITRDQAQKMDRWLCQLVSATTVAGRRLVEVKDQWLFPQVSAGRQHL